MSLKFKGHFLAKEYNKVKNKKPINQYYASEKFDKVPSYMGWN